MYDGARSNQPRCSNPGRGEKLERIQGLVDHCYSLVGQDLVGSEWGGGILGIQEHCHHLAGGGPVNGELGETRRGGGFKGE